MTLSYFKGRLNVELYWYILHMNRTIKKHSVNCSSNIIWECLLRFISCQYSWLYNQLLFITPKIIYFILQSLQSLTEWCLGLFDWTQKLLTEVTGPDCLHDVGRSLVSYVGWEGSCLTRESCFHSCQSELELRNTCDYSAESLQTGRRSDLFTLKTKARS